MNTSIQSPEEAAKKISNNRTTSSDPRIYPKIDALLIQNPSRLWAFPIFGGLIKIIILIPQFFILMVLSMASSLVTSLINPFSVLFSGKYMDAAYDLNVLYLKWNLKVTFFMSGLTNKYPGFSSDIDDTYSITVQKPSHPGKFYAIPIIGALVRGILMIPYNIFSYIVSQAAGTGMILGSFYVLFSGKYPESVFELTRDSVRLKNALFMYQSGLSDAYPSFHISMNHKGKKILLLVLGSIGMIVWFTIGFVSELAKNSTVK